MFGTRFILILNQSVFCSSSGPLGVAPPALGVTCQSWFMPMKWPAGGVVSTYSINDPRADNIGSCLEVGTSRGSGLAQQPVTVLVNGGFILFQVRFHQHIVQTLSSLSQNETRVKKREAKIEPMTYPSLGQHQPHQKGHFGFVVKRKPAQCTVCQ